MPVKATAETQLFSAHQAGERSRFLCFVAKHQMQGVFFASVSSKKVAVLFTNGCHFIPKQI
jgi:hypothetical protein